MHHSVSKNTVNIVKALLIPILVLGIVLFFFSAMNNLEAGQGDQGLMQLENSIRRACTACYASEGVYPPSLAYISEHYGVIINEDEYNVFYEVFSENLMPEITVIKR